MWLTPGRASGRKYSAPKFFMMVELKRGHCTAHSTFLAAPPDMVKEQSRKEARLQSDYIQFMMVCNLMYYSEVGLLWYVEEVSHRNMVHRSGEMVGGLYTKEIFTSVVLKRPDGRV